MFMEITKLTLNAKKEKLRRQSNQDMDNYNDTFKLNKQYTDTKKKRKCC